MAAIRSALETRVQDILIDTETKSVARVVPELQKAQRDIEEIAYKFLIQEEEVPGPPTVALGASLVVAVPTDWLEPRGVGNRLVGGTTRTVAVQVTTVLPIGNALPDSGSQTTSTESSHASVAVTSYSTTAPSALVHSTVVSLGQSIMGGVVS